MSSNIEGTVTKCMPGQNTEPRRHTQNEGLDLPLEVPSSLIQGTWGITDKVIKYVPSVTYIIKKLIICIMVPFLNLVSVLVPHLHS